MAEDVLPPKQSADEPGYETEKAPVERGAQLLGWIMEKVRKWRDVRDQRHRAKWDEYVRIWRGEWAQEDKNRKSERSKIITPATMQAVDSTCAEIEEAVFGREQWFDAEEDLAEITDPNQRDEIIRARDMLRELADEEKIPEALSKIILIGAVYGTGIGKLNVYVKKVPVLQNNEDGTRSVIEREEARVELIPLEPYQFVPDPTTDDLELMLGAAHEDIVPFHTIKEGMRDGRYRECHLTTWNPQASDPDAKTGLFTFDSPLIEGVKITEWHGKVPAAFLAKYLEPEDPLVQEMVDDDTLVEAIVTIANEAKVIGAKANPYLMRDRCFVAYQHDTVPNYFWGRGVPEKGYNSQKALDATVRARIDSLALVANPMIMGDVTRLPRGMNLAVWPGKFWPTTGTPGEVLQGFQFGTVNPELFSHAADMERMVQTATGAMDPGASYSQTDSPQNRALMGSAFIKRARRTMQNIERHLLRPTIRKTMWRYVQFHPAFPQDYQFTVRGTLGVMAREIEQQQLTQLVSLVPNESRPFMAIVKAIFDNSSNSHKGEVLKALDEHLNPEETPEQKALQELQMRGAVAEVAEKEAKAEKAKAEADRARAEAMLRMVEAQAVPVELANEQMDMKINEREVAAFEEQNRISVGDMNLRAVEIAIKALQTQVSLIKAKNEAKKLAKEG